VGGVAKISDYAGFAQALLDNPPTLGKRVFDDSKVSDHHAIIPTGRSIDPRSLSRDEQRIFDLVVRRFLGVFYPDAEFAQTEVIVRVGPDGAVTPSPPIDEDAVTIAGLPVQPDRYLARGKVRLVAGWQEVAGFGDDDEGGKSGKKGKRKEDDDEETAGSLPPLAQGERLSGSFATVAKKTKPPARHTEASLLSAMENAGKLVDDEELRAAMKDSGLGTPATRAAIIETLLKRGFVCREGKHLVATPMGIGLVDALPVQSLASPELTGNWEARLARIARGQDSRPAFMGDIVGYVKDLVEAIRKAAPMAELPPAPQPTAPVVRERKPAAKRKKAEAKPSAAASAPQKPATAIKSTVPALPRNPGQGLGDLICPACRQGRMIAGKRGWGCSRWREGCSFVVWFEADGQKRSEADLRALVKAYRP
jgi:DNA topoisomerase-3